MRGISVTRWCSTNWQDERSAKRKHGGEIKRKRNWKIINMLKIKGVSVVRNGILKRKCSCMVWGSYSDTPMPNPLVSHSQPLQWVDWSKSSSAAGSFVIPAKGKVKGENWTAACVQAGGVAMFVPCCSVIRCCVESRFTFPISPFWWMSYLISSPLGALSLS